MTTKQWTVEEQREHRREWARRLRSGKYKQGEGRLTAIFENEEQDCCLGVAMKQYCEMVPDHNLVVQPRPAYFAGNAREALFYQYKETQEQTWGWEGHSLLPEVRDYLGLVTENGDLGDAHSLAGYNDNGYTFEMIAKIIEEEPEGLVVKEAH